MTISDASWDAAVSALESATRVTLACHVGPDGDALGSMLALGLALRARGVDVAASWGSEPFEIPKQYAYLPGGELLVPAALVDEAPDLMVTFDAGSLERLGSLEPTARRARTLVVVDHHASNDDFGHVNLVDPQMAASAGVVYQLLRRLGAELNYDIATCLYTGLVTDTGRFQYASTTPEIHRMAADLLSHGVAHDEIGMLIYGTHSVAYLHLTAKVLSRVELRPELVWTWMTQEDLADASLTMEDTEALIDLVRTADSADVAAIVKEQADGRYKVSMRSRGATDVGSLCERLGGGGHRLAAGYVSTEPDPKATIERIAALLRE